MISSEISDQTGNQPTSGPADAQDSTRPDQPSGPAQVSHVADFYTRYFGDTLTLHTRLEIRETIANGTLRIILPAWVTIEAYQATDQTGHKLPVTSVTTANNTVIWPLPANVKPGDRYDYQTIVKIRLPLDEYNAGLLHDTSLESRAVLTASGQEPLAEEWANVAIKAKGNYLKHLPALYESDEFMARFLMLFESFWAPIEGQIKAMDYIFDPRITPRQMLPWLASWLDLAVDEHWPEAKQRQLIRWAIALHRSRGTRWGLLKYLEIYTGQQARITEYRSKNFTLGPDARLGPSIALGRQNMPHTFTVSLRLPPVEAETDAERARLEALRRRTIESIIEMQKPAHTVYSLDLRVVSPEELESPAETTLPPRETAATDEIAAQTAIWFKLDEER